MKHLIIFLTFAVWCCTAAPANPKDNDLALQRPSPINPDVLSDPKPPETITMITDPKELAKFKRHSEQSKSSLPSPSVIPKKADASVKQSPNAHQHPAPSTSQSKQHHRDKRDEKVVPVRKTPDPHPASGKSSAKKQSPSPPHNVNTQQSKKQTPTSSSSIKKAIPPPPPSPPKHRQKRSGDSHNKDKTILEPVSHKKPLKAHEFAASALHGIAPVEHSAIKRAVHEDKEEHTENSGKTNTENVSHNKHSTDDIPPIVPNEREDNAVSGTVSTTDHPALRHHPVPVAELFGKAHTETIKHETEKESS